MIRTIKVCSLYSGCARVLPLSTFLSLSPFVLLMFDCLFLRATCAQVKTKYDALREKYRNKYGKDNIRATAAEGPSLI